MSSQVFIIMSCDRVDNNCLYTWGDIHRQPYGIETNEALVATPVKKVNNAGKVYEQGCSE